MKKDFKQTVWFFVIMQLIMVIVSLAAFFVLKAVLPPQRNFMAIIAIFILGMGVGVVADFFLHPISSKPAFFASFTAAIAGLLAIAPIMFSGFEIDHLFGWSYAAVCIGSVYMTSVKVAQFYHCSYLLTLLTHFGQVAAVFFPIYFTIK